MITALLAGLALSQAPGASLLSDGVRYETAVTVHGTESRATLYAVDAATGLPLWSTTVYALPREPDTQGPDVPVSRIWFENGQLYCENARGERFRIDAHSHAARRQTVAQTDAPTDKAVENPVNIAK